MNLGGRWQGWRLAPPTSAERKLWHLTTPGGEDRVFRQPFLKRFPAWMANEVANRYLERHEHEGLAAANTELRERWGRYHEMPWHLGMCDEELSTGNR